MNAREVIKKYLMELETGEKKSVYIPEKVKAQLRTAILTDAELRVEFLTPRRKFSHISNRKPDLEYHDSFDK
jgi:hypothetical protein